jgi:hypothetical protein
VDGFETSSSSKNVFSVLRLIASSIISDIIAELAFYAICDRYSTSKATITCLRSCKGPYDHCNEIFSGLAIVRTTKKTFISKIGRFNSCDVEGKAETQRLSHKRASELEALLERQMKGANVKFSRNKYTQDRSPHLELISRFEIRETSIEAKINDDGSENLDIVAIADVRQRLTNLCERIANQISSPAESKGLQMMLNSLLARPLASHILRCDNNWSRFADFVFSHFGENSFCSTRVRLQRILKTLAE